MESKSFLPLGVGGDDALLVAKLPMEGLLDFSPASNAISRFVQPLVFNNAGLPDFGGTDSVPFVVTPAAVAPGSVEPKAPVDVTSTVTPLTD